MEQVIVVWASSEQSLADGFLNVLSFGDGTPRIYEKDNVDPRAGKVPFHASLEDAVKVMKAGPLNAISIPLEEARKFSLA